MTNKRIYFTIRNTNSELPGSRHGGSCLRLWHSRKLKASRAHPRLCSDFRKSVLLRGKQRQKKKREWGEGEKEGGGRRNKKEEEEEERMQQQEEE